MKSGGDVGNVAFYIESAPRRLVDIAYRIAPAAALLTCRKWRAHNGGRRASIFTAASRHTSVRLVYERASSRTTLISTAAADKHLRRWRAAPATVTG